MNTETQNQTKAAFALCVIVGQAIREAGSIPSGLLYAALMAKTDIEGFQGIIRTLKNAGVISEAGNVLTWTGPKGEA